MESVPAAPALDHVTALQRGETLVRAAAYIGSFAVEGADPRHRSEFAHRELDRMRNYNRSKPVQLWLALSGIKVCDEFGRTVYMAHALRRISYASCNPDHCQFAFMAREPKAQVNLQYCHAFVTVHPDLAEELNNLVGDCFKLAYTLQQQQKQQQQKQQQQILLQQQKQQYVKKQPLQQPQPINKQQQVQQQLQMYQQQQQLQKKQQQEQQQQLQQQ
uniref:PID domain-containing protein n=1 Tax=Macrostomum lignano TaxID=282301 RepID=A0A1I8F3A2_9PLAT